MRVFGPGRRRVAWAAAGIGVAGLVVIMVSRGLSGGALPGLAVADQAQPGSVATMSAPGFTDSFGTAVNNDPGYGLNDSLNARQSGTRGVTGYLGGADGRPGGRGIAGHGRGYRGRAGGHPVAADPFVGGLDRL